MALLPFRWKSYSGFLRSEKIHRPRLRLNPRTWDPVASLITTGLPGSTCLSFLILFSTVNFYFLWWLLEIMKPIVVVDLAFTTLFISQVISVAFYSEREKSDKFCSEALISAWGSFTCRESTTRDPWLYFPSEGSHTQYVYALKKSIDPGRVCIREPRSGGEYDNHETTGVDMKPLI